MTRSFLGCMFACVLASTGCPPPAAEKKPSPAPTATCTQLGQSCQFAPGKLGSCVIRDDCTGTDCFVCQSQH